MTQTAGAVTVNGLLSPPVPECCGATKECQYTFLNGRWLRNSDVLSGPLNAMYAQRLAVPGAGRGGMIPMHVAAGGAESRCWPRFVLSLTCPSAECELLEEPQRTVVFMACQASVLAATEGLLASLAGPASATTPAAATSLAHTAPPLAVVQLPEQLDLPFTIRAVPARDHPSIRSPSPLFASAFFSEHSTPCQDQTTRGGTSGWAGMSPYSGDRHLASDSSELASASGAGAGADSVQMGGARLDFSEEAAGDDSEGQRQPSPPIGATEVLQKGYVLHTRTAKDEEEGSDQRRVIDLPKTGWPKEQYCAGVASAQTVEPAVISQATLQEHLFFFGQLQNQFLLAGTCSCGSRSTGPCGVCADMSLLLMFDQHAADERVRLEQLQRRLDALVATGELPTRACHEELAVTHRDAAALADHRAEAAGWGFRFAVADRALAQGGRLVLTETPLIFCEALSAADLLEFVRYLAEDNASLAVASFVPPPAVARVIASRACKAAVKFGDEMGDADSAALLRSLVWETDLPFQCAHGRPTVVPLFDLTALRRLKRQQSGGLLGV